MTGATDLTRLEKAGIRLKKDKCAFMLAAVEYLGHENTEAGLKTTVDKVVEAPVPKDVSQLRSFLGLVNCSRPNEPAVAEVELGKCPIKGISGSKGSPHFSNGTNTLQSRLGSGT